MIKNFFSFDRKTMQLYILLVIIGLTILLTVKYAPFLKREQKIFIEQPADSQRLIDISDVDTLHINTATASQMKYFGFKNWEIIEICMCREAGCIFNSINDIISLRNFDSLRITMLAPKISFDTTFVANNRYDRLFWKYNKTNQHNKYQRHNDFQNYTKTKSYANTEKNINGEKNKTERIPLFKADSTYLINKGINPQVWDTISTYQNQYVLGGSITLDSLLTATPDNISNILKANIKSEKKQRKKAHQEKPNLLEINSATIEDLTKLHGIKERLASIIISYRDKLGGFVDIKQLKEIYVIDSISYPRIARQLRIDPTTIKRIEINKWSEKQLKRHPYIDNDFAFRIYKQRHKKRIQNIEQLRKIYTEGTDYTYFEKYISFE